MKINDIQITNLMNQATNRLFRNALRVSWKNPSMIWFLLKTIRAQSKAARKRKRAENEGIHVPAFMIMSLTRRCNLTCRGCYANLQFDQSAREMTPGTFERVMSQASELGVSIILLAGGEPLLRPELLDIAVRFPEIVFPVFTNGLLFDDKVLTLFKKNKNIIPIISMEGFEAQTDDRRGKGVYRQLESIMQKTRNHGVFTGLSLTFTRQNVDELTEDTFVRKMAELGCRLFFYVEYVPVQEGTEEMLPTQDQRNRVKDRTRQLEFKHPALFISFPGDEEQFGGCLSSGRGFIHVNPSGQVEPCPFAPFSDTDLNKVSLREALQSKLLRTIRANHDQLSETSDGCALFAKRDWVRSLVDS